MKKKPKLTAQIFGTMASFFLGIQLLGLWTGWTFFKQEVVKPMPVQTSIIWFLVAFLIATVILILLLRFFKGKLLFGALFAFLIFMGSQTVFGAALPALAATILALVVVAVRFLVPSILTQNVAIALAVAGIGAQIGLMLPIAAVLVILLVLSVYDIIAVYGTKHMVRMFKGFFKRGLMLSIIVPMRISDIGKSVKVKPGRGRFLILGTGDIAFPVIFSVSALNFGLRSSFAVIAGSLVGLLAIHFILSRRRRPIPALPPIALFSVLGFFISIICF